MAAHKIIFVSQEIFPYLSATGNAQTGRSLPQSMQSRKYEVRTFMPDYGDINERRNQLHEVIRLSGMNIVIGENDHPLVVKVASMQPSRIQVYFIDNEDYFQKLASDADSFGVNRADNDERLIFFARGTMETARKLRWEPDFMQISGWISTLIPLYVKQLFSDGPAFHSTKVIYSFLPETLPERIDPAIFDKLRAEGVSQEVLDKFRDAKPDMRMLQKLAIEYSDAVVFHDVAPDPELTEYAESLGKVWKAFEGEGDHAEDYDALYASL